MARLIEPSSRPRRRRRSLWSGLHVAQGTADPQLVRRLPPFVDQWRPQTSAHQLDVRRIGLELGHVDQGQPEIPREIQHLVRRHEAVLVRLAFPAPRRLLVVDGQEVTDGLLPVPDRRNDQVQAEFLAEHLDDGFARQKDTDEQLTRRDFLLERLQLVGPGLPPELVLDLLPARLHEPALLVQAFRRDLLQHRHRPLEFGWREVLRPALLHPFRQPGFDQLEQSTLGLARQVRGLTRRARVLASS